MRPGVEAVVVSHHNPLPDQTGQAGRVGAVRKPLVRHEETVRRLVVLSLLYLILPVQAMFPLIDPDIWWHLRTGQWIIAHGTVPTADPFSTYGMGKPWIAYSWLFEVLVYGLYQAFGLVGLVLYTIIFSLMITAALHALVRKLELSFVSEVALTVLGLMSMKPLMHPRPWFFTILFFILELDILLAARRSGDSRRLLLLPPLFALWANTHIQFVYGLFVLGLATAEPLIDRLCRRFLIESDTKAIPFSRLLLVTTACAIATLATPYHLSLYRVVYEYSRQTVPFYYITELHALLFRQPSDWFVLAATLLAAFSLGWRQDVRPFPLLLLVTGAFLSFRAFRDAWFVAIAAVTIIAPSCSTAASADRFALTKLRVFLVAGVVAFMLVAVGKLRHISDPHLESALAKTYPVAAAAVVEERGYSGPLYNHFDWGGYLIWRLPHLSVAMDGRTNLHGDERIERSLATWAGQRNWASDPELAAARLVIADINSALASLLRLDSRFELVYEDTVAAIFVAHPQSGRGVLVESQFQKDRQESTERGGANKPWLLKAQPKILLVFDTEKSMP